MPALLDRNIELPEESKSQATLIATVGGESWTVAQNWWLVLRREVLERWPLGSLSLRYAPIVAFDDLARACGSAADFDTLVHSTVGTDFARRWRIDFEA